MTSERSLRKRISISLALFSGIVSLVLATLIYLASLDMEASLINDTLNAELEDYIARRHRNPLSLPERTATIRAYVVDTENPSSTTPKEVTELAAGQHNIKLESISYLAGVRFVGKQKFIVLYDLSNLIQREKRLLLILAVSVLLVTIISALTGRWLATLMIAPVTLLAQRVSRMTPEEDVSLPIAAEFPWVEVRWLAEAFDNYLKRLHDFIERERLFTGDVSHELRTPLAVIEGACELLLQDSAIDAKNHKRLLRIQRSVTEMSMITSALLELAREQGEEENHSPVCRCEEAIKEEIERYQQIFSHKPIHISLEIAELPTLNLDHAILSMVFGNLLRNAISFSEEGEVKVRLDKNGISVSDEGPGFESSDLEQLFKPYTRGSKSTGAGLGLSLAWRLCERLHWKLSLANRPEGGAVARIHFNSIEKNR
jgi:signal transduction histidine kinase